MSATIVLAIALPIIISPSCSGSDCRFEDGCTSDCETDDDCEDVEVTGDPLVCQPVWVDGKGCTRKCTSHADCGSGLCFCAESSTEGWCGDLRSEQQVTCRADAPPISKMCTMILHDMSHNCGCTITASDLDACDHYVEMFPQCEQQFDDFFFCTIRLPDGAYCDGFASESVCGTEAAALEACTGQPWTTFKSGCD
jgi:hypothetical protein